MGALVPEANEAKKPREPQATYKDVFDPAKGEK
jgi:hypothetical protein